MDAGTVGLALGAGMLAALNPCGFVLLPAYLSLFVLDGQERTRRVAALRALRATAALTLGFAVVFAVFGLAVAPVAASAQAYLPWFTVALGLVVAAAGVWVLFGGKLPALRLGRFGRGDRPITASWFSMTVFGMSYAVASLTCTIAPFLAVVVAAFRSGSIGAGVVLFLAYALGMGIVVGAAALAIALARDGLIRRMRGAGSWLPRVGGAVLVIAGAYVAWYGAWELRVLSGSAAGDVIVDGAAAVQQWLVAQAEFLGVAGLAVVLALLVVFAVVPWRRRAAQRAGVAARSDAAGDPDTSEASGSRADELR